MQVREKIETEPEAHDQRTWATAQSDPRESGDCGTAYCVAGWAAVLDGQKLEWEENEDGFWEALFLEDSPVSIRLYAAQALGLTRPEGGALFAGHHSRGQVLAHLDALIEAGKNGEKAVLS